MAVKLCIKQAACDGCHIDRCKGRFCPGAGAMYSLGQKFFAGSAFPRDQDRYVARCMKLCFFQYPEHLRRPRDNRSEGLRVCQCRTGHLFPQVQVIKRLFPFQGALHRQDQIIFGDRLDQIVIGAFFQALNCKPRIICRCHHEALGVWADIFYHIEQFCPAPPRHLYVDESDVKRFSFLKKCSRLVVVTLQ